MPSPGVLRFCAIDAGNVNNPGEFWRNGLQANPSCHGIPCRHHSFLRFCRLFANGTPRVVGRQLSEAFPVNGVTAGHFVGGTPGRKEKLLADRTVGFVLSALAIVVVVKRSIDAHSTIVAVLEVFSTAYSTKATVWAVIGLFIIPHPQVADVAMVLPECNSARRIDTLVCFRTLLCVAHSTNYLCDLKSIDSVMGVLWSGSFHAGPSRRHGRTSCLSRGPPRNQQRWENGTVVVTDPAPKGCSTTGCYQCTISNIVIAGRPSDFGTFCVLVGNGYTYYRVAVQTTRKNIVVVTV
mmetsp:Transcript_10216/g.21299  ORF Transcript_10216/g.21299 Transcript_10216/m.21299 type:complete len:294 (+) Transcript_10216:281-1162(+)